MTEMSCTYEGSLRCLVRHGPSGSELLTDAPVDNHGRGEAFSPTDLLATALVSCILTVMGIVAERHGIDLEPCTARVRKTMASEGVRRIALLEVWIELPPHLEDRQRRLLQKAGDGCPVKHSLEGAIPMMLHWS
jgi:putative redox protein